MLAVTLDCLRHSRVRGVILVLGYRADEILRRLELDGVRVVINHQFAEGMSSSIREGLKALRGDEEGVLIVLGDQPLTRTDTVDVLLRAYNESRALAVVPSFDGRWGNPVLVDLSLREQMESIVGDTGCRELIRGLEDVLVVDVDDPGILVDIDTEEDLHKAREMLEV